MDRNGRKASNYTEDGITRIIGDTLYIYMIFKYFLFLNQVKIKLHFLMGKISAAYL